MFNSKHSDEVSRLRDEMNRLFDAKQAAWEEKDRLRTIKDGAKSRMDEAWQRRRETADVQNRLYEQNQAEWPSIVSLRDAMNSAFDRAKASRNANQQMWDEVHRTLNDNNRRIDDLKSQADSMASDMHTAFDNASSAWDNHDGASAKEYSEEGHRLKDELQEINSEVARLINENKAISANAQNNNSGSYLWDEFHRLRDQYNQVRSEHSERDHQFHQAKDVFDRAKAEHEQALADYQKAKADFEQAQARLNDLNQQFKEAKARYEAAKQNHHSSADDIARQAGIPSQYLGNVIVKEDTPGCYSIYFGGAGSPDGPGHGHYVLDNGSVTYHRDPFDPHGAENYGDYKDSREFRDYQRNAERGEIGRLAVQKASPSGAKPNARFDTEKSSRLFESLSGEDGYVRTLSNGTKVFGHKSADKQFSKKNYKGQRDPKDFYQHGHMGNDFRRSEHNAVGEFAIDSLNDPNQAKPHDASYHYENLTERRDEDKDDKN